MIPDTGSLESRVNSFKNIETPILQESIHVADRRIGATEGRAFVGSVNGQNIVIVVATDGAMKGKVISSFIPDENQLDIILSR